MFSIKKNKKQINNISAGAVLISPWKGAVKHERTEKHLKAMDVEPPIENIDIFQDTSLYF